MLSFLKAEFDTIISSFPIIYYEKKFIKPKSISRADSKITNSADVLYVEFVIFLIVAGKIHLGVNPLNTPLSLFKLSLSIKG